MDVGEDKQYIGKTYGNLIIIDTQRVPELEKFNDFIVFYRCLKCEYRSWCKFTELVKNYHHFCPCTNDVIKRLYSYVHNKNIKQIKVVDCLYTSYGYKSDNRLRPILIYYDDKNNLKFNRIENIKRDYIF